MQYMVERKYEENYGALTVTSTGKAYTYPAYYQEFKRVIDACIPKMLSSGNAKTVNYGLLLQEHAVSPHILYIFPFKPQKSKLSFSSMAI